MSCQKEKQGRSEERSPPNIQEVRPLPLNNTNRFVNKSPVDRIAKQKGSAMHSLFSIQLTGNYPSATRLNSDTFTSPADFR